MRERIFQQTRQIGNASNRMKYTDTEMANILIEYFDAHDFAKGSTGTGVQDWLRSVRSKLDNNGWIRVEDRLPEKDTWVQGYSVIAFRHSCQMVVLFGQDSFFAKGFEIHHGDITHWKPLDEPTV